MNRIEISRLNALTGLKYFAAKLAENLTPVFEENERQFNAIKASPELSAFVREIPDAQLETEEAKDPYFTQTHIIKPLGWTPGKEAMRVAVFDARLAYLFM